MPLSPGSWWMLHMIIAAAGAAWARRYALRHALLDQPGERRSHVVATPRGGGIGIVLSALAAMGMVAWWLPERRVLLLAAAAGLVLVAAIGWRDDHHHVSARVRLAVHVFAAAALAIGMQVDGLPAWRVVLAAAAVPVLVNIWNFMDGIDGLAASQALLCSLVVCWLHPGVVDWLPALALAAACMGFLPFNLPLPRTRIFLGDVGSGALGYLLAFAVVAWPQTLPREAIWARVLPVSAFAIDASLTLLRRMLRSEPWWTAHVQHLYQRAARGFGVHWPVTLAYLTWTSAALLLVILTYDQLPEWGMMLAVVAWYLTGVGMWWAARECRYQPTPEQGNTS